MVDPVLYWRILIVVVGGFMVVGGVGGLLLAVVMEYVWVVVAMRLMHAAVVEARAVRPQISSRVCWADLEETLEGREGG
jgi:hypothetical protein